MRVYDEDQNSLGRVDEVTDADFVDTMHQTLVFDCMPGAISPYYTAKQWYQDLLAWRPLALSVFVFSLTPQRSLRSASCRLRSTFMCEGGAGGYLYGPVTKGRRPLLDQSGVLEL